MHESEIEYYNHNGFTFTLDKKERLTIKAPKAVNE
jgi:hypothetical protein